jgi:hypothetical protein
MKKIYECIIDDGNAIYKEFIPADNKKKMLNQWGGNGNFIRIKDVTEEYPISLDCVMKALKAAGFGHIECDIIRRTLSDEIKTID